MGMGVNKSRSDTFIFCVDNRFGGSFTVALADKNYPISCYADICKIGIFLYVKRKLPAMPGVHFAYSYA